MCTDNQETTFNFADIPVESKVNFEQILQHR